MVSRGRADQRYHTADLRSRSHGGRAESEDPGGHGQSPLLPGDQVERNRLISMLDLNKPQADGQLGGARTMYMARAHGLYMVVRAVRGTRVGGRLLTTNQSPKFFTYQHVSYGKPPMSQQCATLKNLREPAHNLRDVFSDRAGDFIKQAKDLRRNLREPARCLQETLRGCRCAQERIRHIGKHRKPSRRFAQVGVGDAHPKIPKRRFLTCSRTTNDFCDIFTTLTNGDLPCMLTNERCWPN